MASLPCLEEGEIALLALAADDPRDVMSFADKEALILQLYNQTQEQELEKAILEQGLQPSQRSFHHAYGFLTTNSFYRTGTVFRRECRGATRDRRARTPRGASYIHCQEEGHHNYSNG